MCDFSLTQTTVAPGNDTGLTVPIHLRQRGAAPHSSREPALAYERRAVTRGTATHFERALEPAEGVQELGQRSGRALARSRRRIHPTSVHGTALETAAKSLRPSCPQFWLVSTALRTRPSRSGLKPAQPWRQARGFAMGRANRTATEVLEPAPEGRLRPSAARDTATEIAAMSDRSLSGSPWRLATARRIAS
jgi:hypothetical protein